MSFFATVGALSLAPFSSALAANARPVAYATSATQLIILPASSVVLDGSRSSDSDGFIASYAWSQASGPNTAVFSSKTTVKPTVSGLTAGTYRFNLVVKDNLGAISDVDYVDIIVNGTTSGSTSTSSGTTSSGSTTSSTALTGVCATANEWASFNPLTPGSFAIACPTGQVVQAIQFASYGTPTGSCGSFATSTCHDPNSVARIQSLCLGKALCTGSNFNTIFSDPCSGTAKRLYIQVGCGPQGPVGNQLPVANAGSDRTITLPTNSTTLSGSATDADGTIKTYSWAKVSGPAAGGGAISAPASASTSITGLVQGTYLYRLTVTDDQNTQDTDDVQVIVNAATTTPTTNPLCAMANEWASFSPLTPGSFSLACPSGQIIQSVQFASYGTPNGSCGSFTTSTCHDPNSVAKIQSLCVGKASCTGTNFNTLFGDPCSGTQKRLYVQVGCATGTATNSAPSANAGSDRAITLPVNSVSLAGSGTDSDGTIATYAWSKVSGPAGGAIESPGAATTLITGLAAGTSVYRLTVKDNSGAMGTDDVSVIVSSVTPSPTPTATPTNEPSPGSLTSIGFTAIPYSDPDIISPGRGTEIWIAADQAIPYPTDSSGFNPMDTYTRFTWAQLENGDGNYTWSAFDSKIQEAINKNQKFSFGIMTYYPDCEGDACASTGGMTYPVYLHNLMQSESVKDWNRGGSNWVPNWNSESFLSRFERLLKKINERIQTMSYNGVPYKNVIREIDVRGYGSWGEWHSASIVGAMSEYPAGVRPTVTSLKRIIDAHVTAFPDIQLQAMYSMFDANYLNNTLNPPEIAYHALSVRNNVGPLGWRRDNWGMTYNYIQTYTNANTRGINGMNFATEIMNRWKTSPVTGEPMNGPDGSVSNDSYSEGFTTTYGGAFSTPSTSGCAYFDLERQVQFYHATSIGNGNYWGYANVGCQRDNIRKAFKAAGYRIVLAGGGITTNVASNRTLSVRLDWKNNGVTPTYEKWNVDLELRNSSGGVAWRGTSKMALRLFLPNTTATSVLDSFTLPTSVAGGTYSLRVIVRDPNGYRKPFPIAIQGRQSDGSYILGNVTVP